MTGDPHVETFDGIRYDFQAAGEFVGIKSMDDDLEVQYRLEGRGQPPRVSATTAVAARVGVRRVVLTTGRDRGVRIDGKPVELAADHMMYLTEDEDAALVREGDSYTIVWPDRSNLHVDVHGSYLSTYFLAPPSRDGRLMGLFGDGDGDPANDFHTRDDRLLPSPPPFSTLYRDFGESWRVRPDESLFDYDAGENSETFTDRSVPAGPASLDDLDPADRTRAEAACRDAGVTAPVPLEECIIDVGFSGDESFIASALDQHVPPEFAHVTAASRTPAPVVSGACRLEAAPAASASWRADAARTGRFAGARGALAGEPAWTARGFRPGQVPLVVDGRVIAARERALVALDPASGRELWNAAGPGRIAGPGLVAAGGAVFAAWEDALAAYDLAGGTECWRLPIGRSTSAAYADGRLYVSVDEGETGWVAAVDASTGRVLWRTDAPNVGPANWPSPTAPAVGGDLVYVADGRGAVALDRSTGAVRWRSEIGGFVSATLTFADGVVYMPDRTRGLHALDATTGAVRWTFSEPGVVMGDPVAIGTELVFVADDRHLHGIDRSTGREVWRIDAERASRFHAPVLVGDRLLSISHQGELVVIEVATGAEVRRVRVVDPVVYGGVAPTVGAGGLYFVLSNTILYGYR
jgi:outer membrane protein assembly factor BamB